MAARGFTFTTSAALHLHDFCFQRYAVIIINLEIYNSNISTWIAIPVP